MMRRSWNHIHGSWVQQCARGKRHFSKRTGQASSSWVSASQPRIRHTTNVLIKKIKKIKKNSFRVFERILEFLNFLFIFDSVSNVAVPPSSHLGCEPAGVNLPAKRIVVVVSRVAPATGIAWIDCQSATGDNVVVVGPCQIGWSFYPRKDRMFSMCRCVFTANIIKVLRIFVQRYFGGFMSVVACVRVVQCCKHLFVVVGRVDIIHT